MTTRDHALSNQSPRKQAATLLRQAHRRLDAGLDASDSCGWAIALLPESRAAQGLMIDALLASGQGEQAHTLATTLLRQRPNDWRLWRRRAQALLALDRLDEAATAIDRALAQRPNHAQTLLLASDIATRRGDRPTALAALERADTQHPHEAHIARRLIRALIDSDRADDAEAVLQQMPDATPELEACVFRAQGRLLDACLTLENAAHYELDEARREQLLLTLIDVHDAARDWPALRAWRRREDLTPALTRRLAETCLDCGAFDEGAAMLAREAADSSVAAERSPLDIALKAAAGDTDEAHRMLATPRLAPQHIEPMSRCRPWLRGMLGMIVAEQTNVRDVRRAGADPSMNVLDGLLESAMSSLDAALNDANGEHADSGRIAVWREMNGACEQSLRMRSAPAGNAHIHTSVCENLRQAA